jgi:hypothetical protein
MTIIKVFLLAFFIILLLASSYLVLLGSSKNSKNEYINNIPICPSCGKFLDVEKSKEELIGVFRKNKPRPFLLNGKGFPLANDDKMARYEKYRIHYECRYCGHEVTLLESRKQ